MKSAWLVTWEWIGNHERKNESGKIASILNYRHTPEKVKKHIEQLYIDSEYLLEDMFACAKRMKNNPYPPTSEGGKITCGHNPYLLARKVQNLKLEKDADGNNELIWDEIPFREPIKI